MMNKFSYDVVEGVRVPRRIAAAVALTHELDNGNDGGNGDTMAIETNEARRAGSVKMFVYAILALIGLATVGVSVLEATNDVGFMIIASVAPVLVINAVTYFLCPETMVQFLASRIFGVASSWERYLRQGLSKGLIVQNHQPYEWGWE
jgi:hypothetical protein